MEKKKGRKTFYSPTISRRDFMKMIGLGAGAAGFSAIPLDGMHDLDAMKATTYGDRNLPFWVKEVDKPTVEIDYDAYQQFPHVGATCFNPTVYGVDEYMALMKINVENARKNILANTPSRSLKDYALQDAGSWGWGLKNVTAPWTGPEMDPDPTRALRMTPEELGVPKYEGTPEENSRMIRTATRIFGAFDVGFVKLNKNNKKFLYGNLIFEDVEEGYDPGDGRLILPNKDLWVIVAGIPQSLLLGQHNNWAGSYAHAYSQSVIYSNRIQTFLKNLGYQGYGGDTSTIGIAPAFGALAGISEYARTGQMVSPHVGNMFRTAMLTITDLPLAETKPINAGILEFCKTCKKCAESCPSGAISMETEPTWITESPGPWQSSIGIKGYQVDTRSCFTQMFTNTPACDNCQVVCPFSKYDKAALHEVIKATIGITPATNKLIATLDDAFGYGMKTAEDASVWNMDPYDVPLWGLDTSRS